MKKALLFYLILSISVVSLAQTKEETKSWLIDKFVKYKYRYDAGGLWNYKDGLYFLEDIQSLVYSDGKRVNDDFIIKYKMDNRSGEFRFIQNRTHYIRLDKITSGGVVDLKGEKWIVLIGHKSTTETITYNTTSTDPDWETVNNKSSSEIDIVSFKIALQWESDLANRVDKAIKKLIAYNEQEKPKVKEPF